MGRTCVAEGASFDDAIAAFLADVEDGRGAFVLEVCSTLPDSCNPGCGCGVALA